MKGRSASKIKLTSYDGAIRIIDVMLMLDDMPSTTYYRNRKKAIRLYATMLWAFTRPEKIQNKMEEINWKKSGSKVAVN